MIPKVQIVSDGDSIETRFAPLYGLSKVAPLSFLSAIFLSVFFISVTDLHAVSDEGELKWNRPGQALDQSLDKLFPVIVLLALESDEETTDKLANVLEDSSVKKLLSEVVLLREKWIKTEKGWQWSKLPSNLDSGQRKSETTSRQLLERLIGASGGKSVVAIFDPYLQKGTVLTPSKLRASNVRKAIRATTKICDGFRRSRELAGKLLDKAQMQVQDVQNAPALRTLAGLERFRFPENEPLLNRRVKLMEILEERWKKARFEAREMERSNRLAAAAARLEEILKEFPYPDWEKEIREDIGRVWRRIQGPGGGTPNR